MVSGKRRICRILSFVTLPFLLASCKSKELSCGASQGVNLPPLFTYTKADPVTGTRNEFDLVFSLAGYAEKADPAGKTVQKEFFFRPLADFREDLREKSPRTGLDLLWPLGGYRNAAGRSFFWFFPAFHVSEKTPKTAGEGSSFTLFPLVHAGKKPSGEVSFALFPLYGNLKGAGSWDTLEFFLFPLWCRGQRKDGFFRSVLWPLAVQEKLPKMEKHRILPFYAWKRTGTGQENLSLLFPLFNCAWRNGRGEKKDFSLLLPLLFGYEKWGTRDSFSLFWPLLTLGKEKSKRETVLSILGPFFRYGDREGDSRWQTLSVFPFWGYFRRPHVYSMYILYPFYVSSYGVWEERKTTLQSYFPFFQIRETEVLSSPGNGKGTEKPSLPAPEQENVSGQNRVWHIWPFYSRERSGDTLVQRVPDILPFARKSPAGRTWGELFTLYEGVDNEKGSSFSILWGLGRSTEGKNYSSLAVGPFYMHRIEVLPGKEGKKDGEKEVFLDIFFSMVRIMTRGDASCVRLFWFLEF